MNLSDVKQALNIDFPDQDGYITRLMNTAFSKAKSITGLALDEMTVKDDYPEIYGAIINDIASMYQSRGENETGSRSSMAVYRRHSTTPMFRATEEL